MEGKMIKKLMGEVEDYQFQQFTSVIKDADHVETYNFAPIGGALQRNTPQKEKEIFVERKSAQKTGFKISPIVQKHRGIKAQEEQELEDRINDEVERRVAAIQEEAYQKGYEEGIRYGKEEVYDQTRAQIEEKLSALDQMISDVLSTQHRILRHQKNQLYQLINTLTKWVILRELNTDGKYVERLLEKLITEMQTKSNLFIQVKEADFAGMPEVLEAVQKKMGGLHNVRTEINHDLEGPGLILECENGIINGSFNEQMKGLDKLFEGVLVGDE